MTERSQFGRKPLPRAPGGRLSSMPEATIAIILNGEPSTIEGDAHLSALVEKLKLRPQRIAVEINRQVVPKSDYAATILRAGDEVEIINFVGGG
jgi:sulfur carrier protein